MDIVGLVMRQGFKIVGAGLAFGLLVALVLARLIESILYGVSWNDPVAIGLTRLALCLAGTLACLLPVIRATRVDPIAALRE